ncbi:uncharacterized protein RHOBADRAFT_52865 [Rhodotorula graminis WP1]|uniref:Uncharacterized protein n=1 Tax=Rhodotorula graminis (strain WP1) TaxID=578459 RepID=A0A194S8W4_RHOGW|nr:uncharacterized protein RHOBADRAFT_52865 [Rhodotorula graminis WP1]KPV75846.1 hypothetical protein RHOBADRAFT_52865 [Rhodotorula graminis WP1]
MATASTASSRLHLFLPDSALDPVPRSTATIDPHAAAPRVYGWGTRTGSALVVVGVVRAVSVQEAAQLVAERCAGRTADEHSVEVLVELDVGEDGQGLAGVVFLDGQRRPSSSSAGDAQAPLVILYAPLKQLELLSLEPLRLGFQPRLDEVKDTPTARTRSTSAAGEGLAGAVAVINGSRLVLHERSRPSPSRAKPLLDSARRIGLVFSSIIHAILSLVLATLAVRVPFLGSIAQLSCFGRQLDTRVSQALSLVPTFSSFHRDLYTPTTAEARHVAAHASYIHFFNLLWLLANDFIVGVALATYVRDNAVPIRHLVSDLVEVHVSAYLRDLLDWLNSWPMGVKLNSEVAGLVCRAFVFLTRVWEGAVLKPVLLHLPVGLIGCAGFLGASSLLALSTDLVSVLTLPFFVCYVAATLVYRWSLRSLGALFNVFRGRKSNPLRNRVEPASYDVDALLLGTLLFVTLSFIFPTLVAFYAAFASSRLLILGVETVLLMGVDGLNSFPLFALLLRIKAPGRLPGGIRLDPCSDKRHFSAPHFHLESHTSPQNQPLSFGSVLSSLSHVVTPLSPSTAVSLLARLCTGRVVWSSSSSAPPAE